MQINVGYFYFIKDKFFEVVNDKELMKNKESGSKRPCYYCFRNKANDEIKNNMDFVEKNLKKQLIVE